MIDDGDGPLDRIYIRDGHGYSLTLLAGHKYHKLSRLSNASDPGGGDLIEDDRSTCHLPAPDYGEQLKTSNGEMLSR